MKPKKQPTEATDKPATKPAKSPRPVKVGAAPKLGWLLRIYLYVMLAACLWMVVSMIISAVRVPELAIQAVLQGVFYVIMGALAVVTLRRFRVAGWAIALLNICGTIALFNQGYRLESAIAAVWTAALLTLLFTN